MTISTETFVVVNTGASANDGTGDSLRAAFVKVNQNFANISDIGFDAANINVTGTVECDGSVTAASFIGDGSQLTNIPGLNGNLTISNISIKSASNVQIVADQTGANVTWTLATDGLAYLPNGGTLGNISGVTALIGVNSAGIGSSLANTFIISESYGANLIVNAYTWNYTASGATVLPGALNASASTITKKALDESDVNTSSKTINFNVGGDELLYLNINTNVAIGYGATIVSGRQVDVTIKNTSGGLLYAHLPNANTNKASGNIQIADQSWARLVFTAFGTSEANVVVAVSNS